MKKILNINKQRIFVFFLVVILFCFSFIGSIPSVLAAELHNEGSSQYLLMFNYSFPDFDFIELPQGVSIRMNNGSIVTDVSALVVIPDGYVEDGVSYESGLYYIIIDSGNENLVRLSSDSLILFPEPFDASQYPYFVKAFFDSPLVVNRLSGSHNLTLVFPFTFKGESFSSIEFSTLRIKFNKPDGSYIYLSSSDIGSYISFDGYLYPSTVEEFLAIDYRFSEGTFPSFLDRVTSGLSAVISWVGTVVTAIVSGELVALRPLVAIGIAVSALLLAWVFIRHSIWGS